MPGDFDVIVVGSGAGGATFAYACARAGKQVLLLERGQPYHVPNGAHDEHAMLVAKKPYDDRPVEVNGVAKRLYVGGVPGGSTALYGAALLRPSREDFQPGRHYGNRIPRAIWDWAIPYDALEPYYTEAEKLYHVAGASEDDFGPLQKPRAGYDSPPLPLHPINRRLIEANRARGLRPFRLPLAIGSDRCLRCHACDGYICPNGARQSAAHLVERARVENLPLHMRTNVEVERLTTNGAGAVDGIAAWDRATGERTVLRARRYVLAAGAIGSPLLLLRSGLDGPLVGRNYMTHLSPIVVGVFPKQTGAESTFVKQVGFADYYLGTDGYEHKLGLVQSLPVPGPLLMAKTASRLLPRWLQGLLRQRMLPLTGIIEDLPDPANRVGVGASGQPTLRHRFSAYDRERGRRLSHLMVAILKQAGAAACMAKDFPSDEHMAHQCGTLRCGTAPDHAVLDPDCRLFGQENVFVVDGSFFPTALGVGPALTILANALRVAAVVQKEV